MVREHDPRNVSRFTSKAAPVIEFHGDQDGTINISHAYRVQAEYAKLGLPYELVSHFCSFIAHPTRTCSYQLHHVLSNSMIFLSYHAACVERVRPWSVVLRWEGAMPVPWCECPRLRLVNGYHFPPVYRQASRSCAWLARTNSSIYLQTSAHSLYARTPRSRLIMRPIGATGWLLAAI